MQFKAFSSRIESRAFIAIAIFSFVPISLLAYASYQYSLQLEQRKSEQQLERQITQFDTDLRQSLDQLLRVATNYPEPQALRELSLVSYHQYVKAPAWTERLPSNKAWLIERNDQLWLVPDPANSDLWLQINQAHIEQSLARIAPEVTFCLDYSNAAEGCNSSKAGADSETNSRELLTKSLSFRPDTAFATNFDLLLHASTTPTSSSKFRNHLLITLFLACLLGISAATLSLSLIHI